MLGTSMQMLVPACDTDCEIHRLGSPHREMPSTALAAVHCNRCLARHSCADEPVPARRVSGMAGTRLCQNGAHYIQTVNLLDPALL